MAKEALYFSHDSNASKDPKMIAMRSVYGTEGYGRYWLLIEMLRDADGYKLEMHTKYAFNAYAEHLKCDCNAFASFLHDCIHEFQLFSSDGNYFWSESLLRRMKLKEEKSEKAKQSAEARWKKSKRNADAPRKDSNASENDALKESKLNNKDLKKEYADYVFLTETEYGKLTELLGEDERERYFLRFASWISGQTKRVQQTRSAYLTILNWYREEQKKNQTLTTNPKLAQFPNRNQRPSPIQPELVTMSDEERDFIERVNQQQTERNKRNTAIRGTTGDLLSTS